MVKKRSRLRELCFQAKQERARRRAKKRKRDMEKVSTKAEDSVSSLMSQGKIVQITCYGRSTFERIAKSIECQKHRELIDYIRQYAYRHSKKNLYKTYGLVDTNEDLMAYISFSLSSIDNDKKLKGETDIPSSITYPISALEITRLLVSDKFKKQGLRHSTSQSRRYTSICYSSSSRL